MKYLIVLLFPFLLFCEDIKKLDKKINYNKNILKLKEKEKTKASKKVGDLAKTIKEEESLLGQLESKLETVSNTIVLNKLKLKRAKKDIEKLTKESSKLQTNIHDIEKKLVDKIIDKYTLTLSKEMIDKKSLQEIINEEKFKLLFEDTKDTILKSNLTYFKLSNEQVNKNKKKETLEKYIKSQENEKEKFIRLKKEQETSVDKLKNSHTAYQKELKSIIDKQYSLGQLLGKLDILKQSELEKQKQKKIAEKKRKERLAKLKKQQKEAAKKKKAKKSLPKTKKNQSKDIKMISKQNLQEEIDLKVRNLGDSSKLIKISKYKGLKLEKPLKSYTISKKFGKYYDPVYKIKLFNESISLKSKTKNAKVYATLKGKVVYAKQNAGALGNVVILKHKNNVHTIYSQLSQIPKTIKVGKWVSKGYTVGRVDETLVFQVTKDNKYLDPAKLFR